MAEKTLDELLADLNPKQAAFLRGLMAGKSQTDAYVEAYGCSRDSARSSACDLLANRNFRPVYVRAMLESFDGLIDGFKRMSPVILRRVGEILESENEAVAARVIDSILDRIGIIKTTHQEVSGDVHLHFDKRYEDV